MKKLILGIVLAAGLAGLFMEANWLHINRKVTCSDCYWPYGWPLNFYHDGGFAGDSGIYWDGVFVDLGILVLIGFLAGYFVAGKK